MADFDATSTCFIFDEHVFNQSDASSPMNTTMATQLLETDTQQRMRTFCEKRTALFYDRFTDQQAIFHFRTHDSSSRMLNHFYAFLHFTNARIGNHFHRFVRDFMHYNDDIYCAAGKIVLALQ